MGIVKAAAVQIVLFSHNAIAAARTVDELEEVQAAVGSSDLMEFASTRR